MQAWSKMATFQGDAVFAKIVLFELFQFGFLISETKSFLMKPVREMISEVF